MEPHRHWGFRCKCTGCEADLCNSVKDDPIIGCNLEKGHPGPCQNTFHPQAGTWKYLCPSPENKLILTTDLTGGRHEFSSRRSL